MMDPAIKNNSAGLSKILPGIFAIAALIVIVSCAHHPEQGAGEPEAARAAGYKPDRKSADILQQLEAEFQRWQGTPHRLGGSSRSGVDCSGFVKAVYKRIFEIDLPRTTGAQAEFGRPVKQKDLRPGDLVFFKPPSYPRHVGIYLNRSEFIHASKSRGVTISRIDPVYWGNYFWTARRLLPDHPNR